MKIVRIVVMTMFTIAASPFLHGQGQRGQQAATPPATAKAGAPIELTGNWAAIVTEDWRWRMVTPPKGDYASIPMTAAAKKIADAWDPAKDEAAGEQCRSFGAAAIMRVPGRLRISWQDDNTLKVETDAGTQTRVFHFGAWKGAGATPTWQGDSIASWELPPTAGRRGSAEVPKFGNLKVVTTHMRPGYLRKNGVPYSANVKLTEYWDLHKNRTGDWLVITTLVDDPEYLQQQYVTSSNFKREPDSSKWEPTPCSARW
jgi:hypothetical protein